MILSLLNIYKIYQKRILCITQTREDKKDEEEKEEQDDEDKDVRVH